jgi:hypothetical protein
VRDRVRERRERREREERERREIEERERERRERVRSGIEWPSHKFKRSQLTIRRKFNIHLLFLRQELLHLVRA